MVDLTTELPGSGGGGNAGSSFSSLYFNLFDDYYSPVLPPRRLSFTISSLAVELDATSSGTIVTYAGTGEFNAIQTFLAGLIINEDTSLDPDLYRIQDAGGGFSLSIKSAGLAITADYVQRHSANSGTWPVFGDSTDPPAAGFMGKVDRTAQVADITSVKLTDTCPVGQYLIVGELECTTGAVGAGTVTVTFSWTNDSGAKTSAVTQTLTLAGSAAIMIPTYLASGDVSWAVTHTGIYSTAAYALRVRIVALG